MTTTDLQKFDELKTQIAMFVAPVKDLTVTDQASSAEASKVFKALSDFEKKVEARRKEIVGPYNDLVGRINDYAKQIKEPLVNAKGVVSAQLIQFERLLEQQRQEALRLEREEKAKREAELRAELERQRLEAEEKARAIREEAETVAMFAAPDEAAIAKAKAEEEAARVDAEAKAEAERKEFETKKAYWDSKKEIEQNKVAGTRRVWTHKVLDLGQVPQEYLLVTLDAKKVKEAIAAGVRVIPGLEIYQELTITSR
jgi:hypothetical protein